MAFDPRFAEIFDFTDEELRANRAGQIAPRQKVRLAQEDTQETLDLGCAVGILFGIAMASLLLCSVIFNLGMILETGVRVIPLLIPIGFILAGVIAYVNMQGNRERRQKYPMPVTALQGQWTLERIEGRSYDRYYLHIGDMRFRIQVIAYDILRQLDPNMPLVVYFASMSQKIMAVEEAD